MLSPMTGYVFFKELETRLLKPRTEPVWLLAIVNDEFLEGGGIHFTLRGVLLLCNDVDHRDVDKQVPTACNNGDGVVIDDDGMATRSTPRANYNTMTLPKELGGRVMWTRRVLAFLNAGLKVSNDRLSRVKAAKMSDPVGCTAHADDEDTPEKIHLFDTVAICYEEGEGAKRAYKEYLGQVQRIYRVPEKGGTATKYLFPVNLREKNVYLRLKLFKPDKDGDKLCFTKGGHTEGGWDILEDCDAVPLHTVLTKVSLRCEQKGDMHLYYLSEEQSKLVKKLTSEIAASVTPETHSKDAAEAEAEARPKSGTKRRRDGATSSTKKADKVAEADRVRGTILHQYECTVNRGQGDYTPPLGWVISEKSIVAQQLRNGGLLADNFLKGRKFIQRFGGKKGETVEWFEGEVVKRLEGSMSDFYDVNYVEKDGKITECKHKCVALGYGRLAADCWCLIEKAAGLVTRRKTANVQKALRR